MLRSEHSSKWHARDHVHTKMQTQNFLVSVLPLWSVDRNIFGPKKSIPTALKGLEGLTLSSGSCGAGGALNAGLINLWHSKHIERITEQSDVHA